MTFIALKARDRTISMYMYNYYMIEVIYFSQSSLPVRVEATTYHSVVRVNTSF